MVYVLCRPHSPRLRFLPQSPRLRVLERDVFDLPAAVGDIAERCAWFFHLAWYASYGEERLDVDGQARNITACLDAVRLAAQLGCGLFVGAGSQAQYGATDALLNEDTPLRPDTAYGAAKLCAEQMSRLLCRRLGMRQVWARILSAYGPCDGPYTLVSYLIRSHLRGGEAVLSPCGQEWDFLFAEDAARALLALAENDGAAGAYCLASGEHRPLREYIEAFRRATGGAARLLIGGKPYEAGQRMALRGDISRLRRDTGFTPRISFPEGIARTLAWYAAHPEALGEATPQPPKQNGMDAV